MADAREQLIKIARRIADGYIENPKVKAVALLGSVARDQADAFSDIDMAIYYDVMPTEDEIAAARNKVPHVDWRRYPGGESDDFFDIYYVDGVECQVVQAAISRIDTEMDAVLKDYSTEHEMHVLVGGIMDALPLYGESVIKRWQDYAASYPDALAEAVVRKSIAFRPLWVMEKRLMTRDAPLLFHQFLMDYVKEILSVLSGLNRLYPQLHFKRLDAYVARMQFAPPNASQRVKDVLSTPPQTALVTLRSLIIDTFTLVDAHMSSVDTKPAREKFEQAPRQLK